MVSYDTPNSRVGYLKQLSESSIFWIFLKNIFAPRTGLVGGDLVLLLKLAPFGQY